MTLRCAPVSWSYVLCSSITSASTTVGPFGQCTCVRTLQKKPASRMGRIKEVSRVFALSPLRILNGSASPDGPYGAPAQSCKA